PFVAICSSCGASPARELCDIADRGLKPLCRARQERWTEEKKIADLVRETVWPRLLPHLAALGLRRDRTFLHKCVPDGEFYDLAKLSSGRECVGHLYCDGNGMGRALAQAASHAEYGAMSKRVDDALHRAVAEAIMNHCPPERLGGKLGAEVLLLGGD